MLISAIPPTLPWLISGLSEGPFLFPTPSGVNVQPSRSVAWLSVGVRYGCLSERARARFPPPRCITVSRAVADLRAASNAMFSFFPFWQKEKVGRILYWQFMFCTHGAHEPYFCPYVMHNGNQTAFQYALLRVIISLQNPPFRRTSRDIAL